MGALAHFTMRAERACPSTGAPPALLRQAVGASALEDLLLWLSAYRYWYPSCVCHSVQHQAWLKHTF